MILYPDSQRVHPHRGLTRATCDNCGTKATHMLLDGGVFVLLCGCCQTIPQVFLNYGMNASARFIAWDAKMPL
jgi:hypothetical protein